MERPFEERLSEQVSLLEDYCDLYDQGKLGHARSIAGRLDVILSMLRSKEAVPFVQRWNLRLLSNVHSLGSAKKAEGFHPLAPLSVSYDTGSKKSAAEFVPVYRLPESIYVFKQMNIAAWMREHVLASKGGRHSITRGVLITQMRNKDGGSHPYSEPEPAYKSVSDKKGLGLYAFGPAGILDYNPPAHIATMRHMAHEIISSLKPLVVDHPLE